jgi:hypothetical protein
LLQPCYLQCLSCVKTPLSRPEHFALFRFSVHLMVSVDVDRLCGLVIKVLAYRSGGPGSIPGATRKKSSGSGTGCTQPREYN